MSRPRPPRPWAGRRGGPLVRGSSALKSKGRGCFCPRNVIDSRLSGSPRLRFAHQVAKRIEAIHYSALRASRSDLSRSGLWVSVALGLWDESVSAA